MLFVKIFAFIVLAGSSYCFAAIEFIASDTTAQVVTIAGSSRNSGISSKLSTGIIENQTFAEVKQNAQGDGGGIASAEIRVDPIGQPTEMFSFMQVTASVLPEFNSGTFSEAKVTYFFSNPIEIEVERGINQGDTRFFIDTVQRTLVGTVTRFNLPQGLHSFEIEVVPGTTVVNPNFSVRLFATDSEVAQETPESPPPTPPLKDQISAAANAVKTLQAKVTKQNISAQKAALSSVKKQLSAISKAVKSAASSLSSTKKKSIITANQGVLTALKALEKVGTKDSKKRGAARSKLLKATQKLLSLVSRELPVA